MAHRLREIGGVLARLARVGSTTSTPIRFLAPLGLAILASGCGGDRLRAENDRLRRENLELFAKVESLEALSAEQQAKLAEAARLRAGDRPDADALAALPRVASIEIGTLSGYYPGDRAKPAEGLAFYIRPLDGRRRFVPAVGTLIAEASLLPTLTQSPDLSPPTNQTDSADLLASSSAVLRKELRPLDVRDAYRSGLTGTHYSIELPFERPTLDRGGTVLLRVRFRDAISGETFDAERIVRPRLIPQAAPHAGK